MKQIKITRVGKIPISKLLVARNNAHVSRIKGTNGIFPSWHYGRCYKKRILHCREAIYTYPGYCDRWKHAKQTNPEINVRRRDTSPSESEHFMTPVTLRCIKCEVIGEDEINIENWELSWCQLCCYWQRRLRQIWYPDNYQFSVYIISHEIYTRLVRDDVITRKHFPRYWPFVRGSPRSPVNSSHKGQWRGALMFSLICAWIDGCLNNREASDLRRHRAHYDVIVMFAFFCYNINEIS